MRKIWVKIDPWNKNLVTIAIEGGVDGLMVPSGYAKKVKALGRIQTIADDGDLKLGEDVVVFKIKSGEDEEEIVKLCHDKKVILECTDWSIIPLEKECVFDSIYGTPHFLDNFRSEIRWKTGLMILPLRRRER